MMMLLIVGLSILFWLHNRLLKVFIAIHRRHVAFLLDFFLWRLEDQ